MLRTLLPLAAMLAGAALAMALIAFVALRLDRLQLSAAPVVATLAATPLR